MSKIRTRFAPSPTGRMHVGNLRTALYAYLVAKHAGGDFILRIEDTDQERYVDGAVDIIYRTLAKTGLIHDEGPDKDGGVGPYVQSERQAQGIYLKYAKKLIDRGEAYYCFCTPERLANLKVKVGDKEIAIYDKHKASENEKGLALWEGLNLFITSYVSTCKSPHFIAYCCQCIPLPTAIERTCMFPSELTCSLLLDSLYLLCKSMMNVRLSSASQ